MEKREVHSPNSLVLTAETSSNETLRALEFILWVEIEQWRNFRFSCGWIINDPRLVLTRKTVYPFLSSVETASGNSSGEVPKVGKTSPQCILCQVNYWLITQGGLWNRKGAKKTGSAQITQSCVIKPSETQTLIRLSPSGEPRRWSHGKFLVRSSRRLQGRHEMLWGGRDQFDRQQGLLHAWGWWICGTTEFLAATEREGGSGVLRYNVSGKTASKRLVRLGNILQLNRITLFCQHNVHICEMLFCGWLSQMWIYTIGNGKFHLSVVSFRIFSCSK